MNNKQKQAIKWCSILILIGVFLGLVITGAVISFTEIASAETKDKVGKIINWVVRNIFYISGSIILFIKVFLTVLHAKKIKGLGKTPTKEETPPEIEYKLPFEIEENKEVDTMNLKEKKTNKKIVNNLSREAFSSNGFRFIENNNTITIKIETSFKSTEEFLDKLKYVTNEYCENIRKNHIK